eukprot:1379231-Amorphochlora_amoeboformis.AAC.1
MYSSLNNPSNPDPPRLPTSLTPKTYSPRPLWSIYRQCPQIEVNGKTLELLPEHVNIKKYEKKVSLRLRLGLGLGLGLRLTLRLRL